MHAITTTLENQIIINTVTDSVSLEELINYILENYENWIEKPVLWEACKASFANIATEEWKSLPYRFGPLSEKRRGEKTALVASKDFPFGMLRMFEMLAESEKLAVHFRTFRDINQAKAWLLSKN